jgi:hypothetical protein
VLKTRLQVGAEIVPHSAPPEKFDPLDTRERSARLGTVDARWSGIGSSSLDDTIAFAQALSDIVTLAGFLAGPTSA